MSFHAQNGLHVECSLPSLPLLQLHQPQVFACITQVINVDVVELTDFTFDSFVTKENAGVWFIRFYAPVFHFV